MESVSSSLVIPSSEPSGTVVANEGKEPVTSTNPTTLTHPTSPDSEALDSLQVIELQTFIERKAWIEEKIKFLEKLPAIEVFVGIEALRSSAEDVPGLPTRPQLQQWLAEHEIIEKETEIFDTGELKKLRKFTRAATQRNLSPEDTDLIELTLTTIYELDKLLHLLRDRSENLDLLGVRLTWEECRIASWVSRRQVIQDLKNFLETRARWSPSVYDHTPPAEHNTLGPALTVRRKGSAASLASAVSEAVLLAPGFSRTARFTQAELLSRDSAQFAARVTSLRHGSIANAGKILDKLIDHSRRPVPEELLDEQDRLEEQGIAHMEHIGKFVMNVVMQWRKADETYVETVKDQMAAKILLDDIDAAMTQHPTVRQSLSFTSRADTLRKRLAVRGDPTARGSTFPCPVHPLFPEQYLFNQTLIHNLSSEIGAALATVKSAEAAAADYRSAYEAVKGFESLVESGRALTTQFKDIVDRLENGVPADNGDGSPPNLKSEACLNVTAHSVFLALMPTTFRELDGLKGKTSQLLRSFPAAVLRLTAPGVDPEFRQDGLDVMEALRRHQENTDCVRAEVSARVDRMREARRLKTLIDQQTSSTHALIKDMTTSMEHHRWQPAVRRDGAPPTPESPPSIPLPALPLNTDLQQQIDDTAATIIRTIHTPLLALLDILEKPLNTSLHGSYDALNNLVHRAQQNMALLTSIQTQSVAMQTIREEVDAWRMHIEDLKVRYDSAMQDLSDPAAFEEAQSELATSHDKLRADVLSFINLLPTRAQFIERTHKSSPSSEHLAHAPSNDTIHDDHTAIPFTARSLDDAVRHDCNDFAMRLNGDLRSLEQKANHLSLTRLAREVDDCLAATMAGLTEASQQLSGLKTTQQNISGEQELHAALTRLVTDIEAHSQTLRRRISQSFSPTRDLLREMSDSPGVHDPAIHESLFLSRQRRQDDAELRFATWDEQVKTLRQSAINAQRLESKRLEELRLAKEAEQERLAEEAIKRQRDEEARVLALEMQKAEEERQAAEVARMKAEESERVRLESERLLVEEKTRQLEQQREKVESARRLEEQRNMATLELEKQAMQMKLRRAEDELAAERQAQADRIAQELQSRLRAEADAQAKAIAFPAKDESSTEDVFGLKLNTSDMHQHKSQEIIDLQVRILNLRKRIRAMSLVTLSRASAASAALPTTEELEDLNREFVAICEEVSLLPSTINDQSAQMELDSLKHEVDVSIDSMERLRALAALTDSIVACDAALSDLLEHIDSFPSIPVGPLSTSYQSDVSQSADEQMKGRLAFTKASMDLLGTAFRAVSDDPRASSEHQRVLQTWSELQDMAQDRISGKKSRPSSATISSGPSTGRNSRTSTVSGRNSRTSLSNMPPPKVLGGPSSRKSGTYANLSVSSRGRGGLAVPSPSRRTVSTSSERTSSRMSISSSRSASGPIGFSVYGSTFASRQRTTSLTPSATPPRRPSATLLPRMQTPTFRRGTASPSISELSSTSNMTSSRPSTSTSSWSRAPRMSLPRSTPPRKALIPRKAYIANPKSKLDVAVGDVVNNLPVGINVEGVSGSWKDQSGKYWIGDQDPRLCFCRILRSQTVMVRVGGGWQELSKFIRGHFADSFRLMPDSPKTGAREERWISSATLAEAVEIASNAGSPPHPPRTPEPRGSFLPSFALSTPSGHSPRSLRSTPSSKGSPLTPLQFMRRAEPESPFVMRPATPSKAPVRSRTIPPSTPNRNSVWRP